MSDAAPIAMSADAKRWQWLSDLNRRVLFGVVAALYFFSVFVALDAHRFLGLLCIFIGYFPSIVLHEVGHALAAKMVGWQVWVINAVPFSWRGTPMSLLFCPSAIGPDVGGFMLASPKHEQQRTRLRQAAITLGGPLINLVAGFALILMGVELAIPGQRVVSANLTFALGVQSLAVGILAAWPFQGKDGSGNDGLHLWRHWREAPTSYGETAVAYASHLWQLGVPPSRWNDWIRDGVRFSASNDGVARYLLMIEALDRGAIGEARSVWESIKTDFAAAPAQGVVDAYFSVFADNDLATAEAKLANIGDLHGGGVDFLFFRLLVLSCLVASDGDRKGSDAKLEELRNVYAKWSDYPNAFWQQQIDNARALISPLAPMRSIPGFWRGM